MCVWYAETQVVNMAVCVHPRFNRSNPKRDRYDPSQSYCEQVSYESEEMKSAYVGEITHLFQHYWTGCQVRPQRQTAQHCTKKKDVTVNWNIPFDKQRGEGSGVPW